MENIETLDINDNNKKLITSYFDKTFFKGLFSILLYYFVFNSFADVMVIVLKSLFGNMNVEDEYAAFRAFGNVIIYLTLVIFLIVIYRKSFINQYKKMKDTREFVIQVITWLIIAYAVNMATSLLESAIISTLPSGTQTTSTNQLSINSIMSYPIGYLLFAPITIIVAPIVEELIFRKSFFNVFKNKWLALIITTVLFGTMHVTSTFTYLQNLTDSDGNLVLNTIQCILYTMSYGLPYYGMGLSFGLMYIKCDKNIYVPIAIHMLNNFVATMASTYILFTLM